MNFGKRFGQLVKQLRGIEGLTQQELAVRAFGNESYKTKISLLENGKVARPQTKTVDALAIALNISGSTLEELSRERDVPRMLDTIYDFFDVPNEKSLDVEIAVDGKGKSVMWHNYPLSVELRRVEFFVDERIFILVGASHSRRPIHLAIPKPVSKHLVECKQILFVLRHPETLAVISGDYHPLKCI